MSARDFLLAIVVVLIWGVNFVVIKIGLHNMPPFFLAGLRFTLVVFPAIFFIKKPKVSLKLLLVYGMTISFGQFAFLFLAIKLGMPAGIASVLIQFQVFFTVIIAALFLAERPQFQQVAGILVACLGMGLLIGDDSSDVKQDATITLVTVLLTLSAALSWGIGNVVNKIITHETKVSVMSLVIWSALVPILPFFICSWVFEGSTSMAQKFLSISAGTVFALIYLAFFATVIGYSIWGDLLRRYETWRIAPFALLVPVVGVFSAMIVLGESLSIVQSVGATVVVLGLLVSTFGNRFILWSKSLLSFDKT